MVFASRNFSNAKNDDEPGVLNNENVFSNGKYNSFANAFETFIVLN